MSASYANTLVVLRHGVRSSAAMAELRKYMEKTPPGCKIDNEDYDWEDFVLHNGIELAEQVLDTLAKKPALTRVIFAGHSQGGLVCRVAVAALCARAELRAALWLRTTAHSASDEATGDRLFTILQKVRVRRVQYVSISGSSVSRYSSLASAHLSLAQIPVIGRLAPALDLPNDGVVEDSSVDLRESPLPPEIADLDRQYQHVRCYIECVRMRHTDLHSDENVLNALENVSRWR